VDMVGKCTGTAEYSIDVRLPGMVYGAVRRNPSIGAPLVSFDASTAEALPGLRKIIPLEDGIVVVATNTWYAMQAARMIDVEWGPAPYPETSEAHRQVLVDAIADEDGRRWRSDGDVDQALEGSQVIEGMYHVPYLAHATMEPLNAVAWLRDGQLDIWAGNQSPTHTQRIGSRIADVPLDSVRVHTTYMGGGFGRRLEMDFIETAVQAARAMPGTPVLVTWPREEDMTHDAYRPMASARFRATLAGGRPVALDLRVSAPNLGSSARRRDGRPAQEVREGIDKFSATGAMDQPYRIEHYRVTAGRAQRLLPVGWWRSVGESQNTFFHESAIDEIAHAAGSDPLEMRLSLLDHAPSRAVLEAVAEMSNWGSDLPAGRARGVAYALSSGAATAQVVEVVHREGEMRIVKSFAAVDVGIALDPRNIEAQVTSGVLFGLCAAMHGEITVTGGRVDQSNFHDYELMRMAQAPTVEVRIHESKTAIYGVGEAGTPTAAPALGNAIYAATGQRIRELPFSKWVRFV
ncbi:MAG: molybdopterin-dependent oxidoreductase, partial [Gemmatimonadota bacterium]|nr:molybdopterin-dependent oxidoreductase [Gemmatimonadota bacterium]